MEVKTAFETLAASLSNEQISHVWRGYGSAIFIEIGDLTPRGKRDGSPVTQKDRFHSESSGVAD